MAFIGRRRPPRPSEPETIFPACPNCGGSATTFRYAHRQDGAIAMVALVCRGCREEWDLFPSGNKKLRHP